MAKNVIIINGNRIEVEEDTAISVKGDSIFVGNQKVANNLSGTVKVKWEGPLASLSADGDVECHDVHGPISAGGSIKCGNVIGSVSSGGSCSCSGVTGSVNAGGSVTCMDVGGDVDAGGSVSMKRK